jgi:hypothetical protein
MSDRCDDREVKVQTEMLDQYLFVETGEPDILLDVFTNPLTGETTMMLSRRQGTRWGPPVKGEMQPGIRTAQMHYHTAGEPMYHAHTRGDEPHNH